MPQDIDRQEFWEHILNCIDEGAVIPVIGHDLLTIRESGDAEATKLYPWMARRVAARVGVSTEDLDADDALNRVACRLLARRSDVAPLYSTLNSLLPEIREMAPPEPLLKLAQIKPLDLFVTTTFDPLLEAAVTMARGAPPQVLAYAPGRIDDLPLTRSDQMAGEGIQAEGTTVYHLFGRLSRVPEYAVTEEDVLEFIHSLGSEARRPRRLFDELADKHLLIIGSCFPDWLARFFIRTSRRERLRTTEGKNDFLVDSRVSDDSSLVLFLKNFSRHTQVFTGGDACAFVDELHARWTARHPADTKPSRNPKPRRNAQVPARAKIFLSYASEDRNVAAEIYRKLTAAKLPVWFDLTSLAGGEKWREALNQAIEQCSVFVPILSQHNLHGGIQDREFRTEWAIAARVAETRPRSLPFIVPVVVDDTDTKHPDLRPFFGNLHCLRIGPNERPSEFDHDLVGEIRTLYRQYQKEKTS
jgi:hypothetical protein